MKLLTRMSTYASTTLPPKDVKDVEGTHSEVKHDLLAAHALMQAMDEDDRQYSDSSVQGIRERADAILAGWTGAGE